MDRTYNLWQVVMAVSMAILASYIALDRASRITAWRKTARRWLAVGATAMGASIWSMHLIDMLAFQLPMSMSYNVSLTMSSLFIAMLAAMFVLRETQTLRASHGELDMSVQRRTTELASANTAIAGRDFAAQTRAARTNGPKRG